MSLTVPTAGVIGGRSADVRIATPDTGQVVSEFGAKVAELAQGWKREQLQAENVKAQLGITRDLGQARLEAEQIGDPAVVGPTYDARVAEVRKKYITPDTDPELAASLDQSIGELSQRHGFALSQKVINLTRSQREADWIAAREDIANQAVTADPETFGALIEVGEAAIDTRVQNGLIDPEQGAKEKQALRQDVYLGRANALIESDPQAYLNADDAGEMNALGGELRSSRRLLAMQELSRRADEADRAAKVAAKARQDEIGKTLADMTSITAQGYSSADEARANDPEFQAHPDFPKYLAARELRDEMPGIRQMTEADLRAAIAKEEAKPKTKGFETERVKVLKEWLKKTSEGYATAPVETAIKVGLPVPQLPAFDSADPAPFAKGLSSRISFEASQKGRFKGPGVFTADERQALKPVLDPKADTAPKIALAQSIIAAAGPDSGRIAGLLGADPVYQRAIRVLSTTGDKGLAESMLRGQQKIELKTVVLPTEPKMVQVFNQISGGAFQTAGMPAAQADAVLRLASEVTTAARAIYADTAPTVDPEASSGTDWTTSDAATTIYADAVKRALGATADTTGALNIGGLAEINGGYASLPPSVPVKEAEAVHEAVRRQIMGYTDMSQTDTLAQPGVPLAPTSTAHPVVVPARDPLRALEAASVTGMRPDLGKDAADRWSTIQFRRIGQSDQYELFYVEDGRVYTVRQADDPRGRAYRMRLPDLISEAGKP